MSRRGLARWAPLARVLLFTVAFAGLAWAGPLHHEGSEMHFAPAESNEEFSALVESWHEFFLMTGTAAVTLVGLLFVALSIHLDVLLHEKRAHLLDLARQAQLTFVVVLLLSLMYLVPPSTPRILALSSAGMTLVAFGIAVAGLLKEMRTRETGLDRRALFRRRLSQILGLALSLFASWLLWQGEGIGLFVMIGPICLLLGNATGSAWDLLVQVGKLKAREQESSAR